MSKFIIKISLLLLFLNPNLSWGKGYITCKSLDREIINFSINKTEIKLEKINISTDMITDEFNFTVFQNFKSEETRVIEEHFFIYKAVFDDELNSYQTIMEANLDTLSGSMGQRYYYKDKGTERIFVFKRFEKNIKIFKDEEPEKFDENTVISAWECEKSIPLYQ